MACRPWRLTSGCRSNVGSEYILTVSPYGSFINTNQPQNPVQIIQTPKFSGGLGVEVEPSFPRGPHKLNPAKEEAALVPHTAVRELDYLPGAWRFQKIRGVGPFW